MRAGGRRREADEITSEWFDRPEWMARTDPEYRPPWLDDFLISQGQPPYPAIRTYDHRGGHLIVVFLA